MRHTRRGLLALGAAGVVGFLAGCSEEPKAPLEPTAGMAKAVLVADGMH